MDAAAQLELETLRVPLTVAGKPIGTTPGHWRRQRVDARRRRTSANSTAAQLAQHIDGLRLLAQAQKYRAEAEQAVRRLTREGWKTYQEARDEIRMGYVFDLNQVKPFESSGPNGTGQLAARNLDRAQRTDRPIWRGSRALSGETAEIVEDVAERLSSHLENLRLLDQNEKRARELEIVAELSATTSTVLNPDRLLQAIVDTAKERFGVYHVHIYLADAEYGAAGPGGRRGRGRPRDGGGQARHRHEGGTIPGGARQPRSGKP